jgi:hypothetical protein
MSTRGCDECKIEKILSVNLKCTVFWGAMSCRMIEVCYCFGGSYSLHLQGQSLSQASNKHSCSPTLLNADSQITECHICFCNRFADGEKTSVKGKDDDSSGDEEEKKSGSDSEDER